MNYYVAVTATVASDNTVTLTAKLANKTWTVDAPTRTGSDVELHITNGSVEITFHAFIIDSVLHTTIHKIVHDS